MQAREPAGGPGVPLCGRGVGGHVHQDSVGRGLTPSLQRRVCAGSVSVPSNRVSFLSLSTARRGSWLGVGRAGSSPVASDPSRSLAELNTSPRPLSRWLVWPWAQREAGWDFPGARTWEPRPPSSSVPSSSPLVTSPRFELPMGTTEQPPLPQETQPPTKVPCPGPAVLRGPAAPWPQRPQCPPRCGVRRGAGGRP